MKKVAIGVIVVAVALAVLGGSAEAVSESAALNGLNAVLSKMVDAFVEYLGALT